MKSMSLYTGLATFALEFDLQSALFSADIALATILHRSTIDYVDPPKSFS